MGRGGIYYIEKGDFKKLTGKLESLKEVFHAGILDKYGKKGVEALRMATPVCTGLTAASWYYTIENNDGKTAKLIFNNSNVQNGSNIALIIQYGHATQSGCWVEGQDYINPALMPIFEELCDEIWREVKRRYG